MEIASTVLGALLILGMAMIFLGFIHLFRWWRQR